MQSPFIALPSYEHLSQYIILTKVHFLRAGCSIANIDISLIFIHHSPARQNPVPTTHKNGDLPISDRDLDDTDAVDVTQTPPHHLKPSRQTHFFGRSAVSVVLFTSGLFPGAVMENTCSTRRSEAGRRKPAACSACCLLDASRRRAVAAGLHLSSGVSLGVVWVRTTCRYTVRHGTPVGTPVITRQRGLRPGREGGGEGRGVTHRFKSVHSCRSSPTPSVACSKKNLLCP